MVIASILAHFASIFQRASTRTGLWNHGLALRAGVWCYLLFKTACQVKVKGRVFWIKTQGELYGLPGRMSDEYSVILMSFWRCDVILPDIILLGTWCEMASCCMW